MPHPNKEAKLKIVGIVDLGGYQISLAADDLPEQIDVDRDIEKLPKIKEAEILMTGDWKGHKDGPFQITEEQLQQFKTNFDSLGRSCPIDYQHNDAFGKAKSIEDGIAAGWLVKNTMKIKENNRGGMSLFVDFALTPRAAEFVENKEYRFLSPAFGMRGVDRISGQEIGPTLDSVALTNHPFLENMKPLSLSAKFALSIDGIDEDDDGEPRGPDPKPKTEDKKMSKELLKALGVDSEEKALDAIKELKGTGDEDQMLTLKNEHLELKATISNLEKEKKELSTLAEKGREAEKDLRIQKRDERIEKALSDEKIEPWQVEGWEKGKELKDDCEPMARIAEEQPDNFDRILKNVKAKDGDTKPAQGSDSGKGQMEFKTAHEAQEFAASEIDKLMKEKKELSLAEAQEIVFGNHKGLEDKVDPEPTVE